MKKMAVCFSCTNPLRHDQDARTVCLYASEILVYFWLGFGCAALLAYQTAKRMQHCDAAMPLSTVASGSSRSGLSPG